MIILPTHLGAGGSRRRSGQPRQVAADAATSPSGSRRSSARSQHPLIVDAGPLYAYVDADAACLDLLETHPGPLVVPVLVVTEVVCLLRTRLGWEAEARFLGDLANGTFVLEPVHPADPLRMIELVAKYHDLPRGSVDASVIAAAERLGVTEVATVDRRHFSVVHPRHAPAFDIQPAAP